jgi:hypothetical protein
MPQIFTNTAPTLPAGRRAAADGIGVATVTLSAPLPSMAVNGDGIDRDAAERLLTTTRSVRRRLALDRDVDVDDVHDCLRIALQAPTGSNNRSWRFLVVTGAPGIPAHVTQCGLIPVGRVDGDFRPAWREPVDEVTFHDRWGEPFAAASS